MERCQISAWYQIERLSALQGSRSVRIADICLVLSVCRTLSSPQGAYRQAGTAELAPRPQDDPLAQSRPEGGGAVTTDGRACYQIPEARPAVGLRPARESPEVRLLFKTLEPREETPTCEGSS